MAMKPYARGKWTESLRRLLRMLDFLLLLRALRRRGQVPAIRSLRRTALVELGPGPMRLASLKRRIFSAVIFLDQCDCGIPDRGLRTADFEEMEDARQVLTEWCRLDPSTPALFLPITAWNIYPRSDWRSFFHPLPGLAILRAFAFPTRNRRGGGVRLRMTRHTARRSITS
jgi:hypothetical protein